MTKTAKATAVAALLRRAIIDWGVPEVAKTDNGSDYKGHHMTRVFNMLNIEQELCPPFSPWHKPHIERFFRSFSHSLVELLPGFIGHNVAERKAIESRKAFSDRLFKKDEVVEIRMTSKDFQEFCDDWCNDIYLHNEHSGLGKTPLQMVTEWKKPIRRVADERALDMLLAPTAGNNGKRTVSKKGIRIDKGLFVAPELYKVVNQEVLVLEDPIDLGRVYVYGGPDFLDFICIAEDPERTGIDRAEVAARAKELQKKEIQEARRALKAGAKTVNIENIVNEIRADAAKKAGKVILLPKQAEEYTSPGLEAAAKAAEASASQAVDVAPQIDKTAFLREALKKAEAEQAREEAAIKPLDDRENYLRWKAIDSAIAQSEAVSDADAYFHRSFKDSSTYRAQKTIEEDFAEYYQTQ